jgi:hypothetical protein
MNDSSLVYGKLNCVSILRSTPPIFSRHSPIGASCVGVDASSRKSEREDLDVNPLVMGDVHEVVVIVGSVASISEILKYEIGEGALVEDILEMLERQSKMEDGSITVVDCLSSTLRAVGWAAARLASIASAAAEVNFMVEVGVCIGKAFLLVKRGSDNSECAGRQDVLEKQRMGSASYVHLPAMLAFV